MSIAPLIAISTGDPAGIGPEIVCKAMTDESVTNLARWLLIGDAWIIKQAAAATAWDFSECHVIDNIAQRKEGCIQLLDVGQLSESEHVVGQVNAACGRAALQYITTAAELCIQQHVQAMVTAPICKESVALNDMPTFRGHTEYIGGLCGNMHPRLMLYNKRVCVVHVSTHCSLREATQLQIHRILETIQVGHDALQKLGFDRPRVAVCGLNPHAGEHGMFGTEEAEFITPSIQQAVEQGIDCSGPYPADSLFFRAVDGEFDLIVAMYHDQGHVPMKLLDFENTVNVTLGLPIIRTSVDHGTAFDIAGMDQASCTNIKQAMQLAARLVKLQ
jgi:4-hydroxythreonine-4-phosphate dehydrogenase